MRFGQLKLGLAPIGGGDGSVPPPTDIAWAGSHTVAEDAALGTVVGGMLSGTDPGGLALTFSMADGDERFDVDGTSVIVIGTLDFETTTSHNVTIRATNSGGASYDEVFAITISNVVETPPDDPLPDGDVIIDGDHPIIPYVTEVDGKIKISGKKGNGVAKFVYDIGPLSANERYIIEYDPDFNLLSDDGANVLVGFVLKTGNDFHIVGLKGDGGAGIDKYKLSGDGLWTAGAGFTEVDGGAPTNGSQAGPNFIKLDVSSNGSTITFSTATSELGPWTVEFTAYIPHPFGSANEATTFGIGAYFPANSSGPYSIGITQWIEETIVPAQWSSTFKNASITLSNNDRTAVVSAGAGNRVVLGNSPIKRKTYWEVELDALNNNINLGVGVQGHKTNVVTTTTSMGAWYQSNGLGSAPLNVAAATGDRMGFAYDPAVAGLWVRRNGSWLGNDPTGAAAITITNGIDRVFVPMLMFVGNGTHTLKADPLELEGSIPAGYSVLEVEAYPGYRWSSQDKGANLTLSENGTKATKSSTGHNNVRLGTEPIKGKQVFAVELTADGAGSTAKAVGLMDFDDALGTLIGGNGFSIGYRSGGTVVRNTSTIATYTAWGTVGDIIMIAANGDTNELWFGLNGTWNGDPAAGTGEVGQWIADGGQNYGLIACGATDSGDAFKLIDWPYAIPSGFTAPDAA